MNALTRTINIINLLSALLTIILSVFHYGKAQNLTLYVFFISYGIEFLLEKKWQDFKWERYSWMYAAFLTFFMMILIWMPFEDHTDYTAKIIEYRLPFLAFGIIGLFGLNKYHKLKYYAFVFISWSIFMILYIIFYKMNTFYLDYYGITFIPFEGYNPQGFMEMINDIHPSQYFSIFRTNTFTSHFIFDFILNLGLISCFYLFLNNPMNKKAWRILTYILTAISYIIILTTLLLSDGRSGLIASYTITALGIFYILWKKSKAASIICAIIISSIGLFTITHHQKFDGKDVNNDPRVIVWKHSLKLIKEKPALGYGAGDASCAIMDELSASQDVLDTHDESLLENLKARRIICAHSLSQILQSTLEFGVLGFIVIMAIIFMPFFATKNHDFKCLALMFVITSFIQLATDIYVSTVPLLPYSLFIIMLLKEDKKQIEKDHITLEK